MTICAASNNPGKLKELRRILERMGHTVTSPRELGLDYVDLNVGDDLVEIDWATDSYDAGDHLNVSGARKVTTAVGSLLAGRYDAPDHRGDDAYDAWAEASARSRGRR